MSTESTTIRARVGRTLLAAAMLAALTVLTVLTVLRAADAQESKIIVGDDAALARALAAARPGTTIQLSPGSYRGGISSAAMHGEPERPIVIAALDPRRPPVIGGGARAGIHLSDAVHVELRDLVIEGTEINGINIDDGGSFDTPSRGVVLRGVVVRDMTGQGNHDGIKLSGVVDFRLEGCRVERWGRGGSAIDMVGCHRGVIERCVFREGDPARANGVQAKGGSRDIAIRRCRFEDAGGRAVNLGGSTGRPYFRPRPEGFEAKDLTVEDCVFIGSAAPVAFVGVDGATVRFNTFYRPRRWAFRILQETQDADFAPCRKGVFTDNVIAYRTDELSVAVNVGGGTAPDTFELARNVWFAIDRPEASSRVRGGFPVAERDGIYGKDPLFEDAEAGKLDLAPGSPARSAGPRPEPQKKEK